MLLPIGATSSMDGETKARNYLMVYTLALGAIGIAAILTGLDQTLSILFFVGIFAFGWVANYLRMKS